MRPLRSLVVVLACVLCARPGAQESLTDAARRKTFDQILDLYVRGGDVYYRAIKAERAKLDGYVNLLATTSLAKVIERNTGVTNLQTNVFYFKSSISGTVSAVSRSPPPEE